jgi:hypothetical protein
MHYEVVTGKLEAYLFSTFQSSALECQRSELVRLDVLLNFVQFVKRILRQWPLCGTVYIFNAQ